MTRGERRNDYKGECSVNVFRASTSTVPRQLGKLHLLRRTMKLWDKRGCVGVEIGSSTSILRALNVFFLLSCPGTLVQPTSFQKQGDQGWQTHTYSCSFDLEPFLGVITLKLKFIMKFVWRLCCPIWVELEFRLESHFQNLYNRCDK